MTTYAIRSAFQGVHEYIPVMFQEDHFCVTRMQVHSVLLDYKYRVASSPNQEQPPLSQKVSEYLSQHFPNPNSNSLRYSLVTPLKCCYQQLLSTFNHLVSTCLSKSLQKS